MVSGGVGADDARADRVTGILRLALIGASIADSARVIPFDATLDLCRTPVLDRSDEGGPSEPGGARK